MMQVIAGIHFNFSFSQDFWLKYQSFEQNEQHLQTYVSDKYFALLRNYKRFCWLIPYLYGSSPALCPSFLKIRKLTYLSKNRLKAMYILNMQHRFA